MKTKGIFLVVLLLQALVLSNACGSGDLGSTPTPSPLPTPAFGLSSELVVAADHPSAMAIAPDGRLFYAEQYTGNVRIVDAGGQLLPEPFAHLDVANWLNLDWGLTGLALDPDFETNHFVYAFYTEPVDKDLQRPIARPKLVRFTGRGNKGESPLTLLDDFPETLVDHQGFKTNGSIHFGPDGFLYATVGDYDAGKVEGPGGLPYALDQETPAGKMLRLDSDGAPAEGNPFPDGSGATAQVFAYGFRRGADFAFDPKSGRIYGTDNTDGCEELNIIEAGGDYGWPAVGEFPYSDCTFGDQIQGIHFFARGGMSPGDFLSPVNVSGMAFISADAYPRLGDSLAVCESVTGVMRRLVLAGARVTADDFVAADCRRGITTDGDGVIYYSNDSEIRRLSANVSAVTPSP